MTTYQHRSKLCVESTDSISTGAIGDGRFKVVDGSPIRFILHNYGFTEGRNRKMQKAEGSADRVPARFPAKAPTLPKL